jgi:hypothetical protein
MPQTFDKPILVVREGEAAGQRWVLHGDELLVGRGTECDIVLPERQVSRQHARIRSQGDHYFIEDLDSKNGTLLNNTPLIGERELRDGDEIEIAKAVKLAFFGSEVTLPLEFGAQPAARGGRLRLEETTRRVFVGDHELDPPLSLPQYRLLQLLLEGEGRVCTREEVIAHVWPDASGEGVSEQAIDALVRRLRDRLGELDPEHQYIVTVRGHGFRLDNPTA